MIGLTGPIGCGKSTVSGWLAELGGEIIDADALARDATAPGEPTLPLIRARFGDAVLRPDGSLDRAALAQVVFGQPEELAALESIIHPHVRVRLLEAVVRAGRDDPPFIAVEAIKLVEGGFAAHCDAVWLIDCTEPTQRERLHGRGMDPADVERRLAAQGRDLADRLAPAATHRLSTEGGVEEVRERIEDALADVLEPVFLDEPGERPSR